MAGSLRKLPSGLWNLRVSAGKHPVTGKRVVIAETMPPGTSKRRAELRLAELVNRRRAPKSGAVTVQAVIDAYRDLTKLERATREKHKTVLKHLPVGFATRKADHLTRRDVSLLYKHLQDFGVGDSTIRALHGLLGAAFEQAFVDDWIGRNPIRGAQVPPEPESRANTVPRGVLDLLVEAAAIHAAKENEPAAPLWLRLHMVTGARAAEVIALRSSSFNGDRVTIDGAIERGTDRARKTTKTKKRRALTLDAETMAMVRDWRQTQRANALAEPDVTLARDPYLFADGPSGTRPWRGDRPSQLFGQLRRVIAMRDRDDVLARDPSLSRADAYAAALELRPALHATRLHDIRHGVASDLLADGVDIPTVAYRLGDDPRTILRVYSHVIEGRDRAAADLRARQLS